MEFSVIHLIAVLINCGWLFSNVDSRTFSLNEAIEREKALTSAAEPKAAESVHINEERSDFSDTLKATEPRGRVHSLLRKDSLTPIQLRLREKFKKATEKLQLHMRKIPARKYKNLFQKKSSIKPKKLLYEIRPFKNTASRKREIYKHGKVTPKYVPLLRRLGDLFDAVGSDESVMQESRPRERYMRPKSRKHISKSANICTCARKPKPQSQEETIAPTSTANTKVSYSGEDPLEAAAATTHHTALSDVSGIRQNQNLPAVPARDTPSSRRNHHGISQGSSPSLHRSASGHHTRDHGDSEHNTRREGYQASATDNEENTSGATRDRSSSDGLDRRLRRDEHDVATIDRIGNFTSEGLKGETATQETGGPSNGFEVENPIKVNRNETEYSESFRGRRGSVPNHQIGNLTKPVQSREDYEKSVFNVTRHVTRHQRVVEGNGEFAEQNQKDDTTHKTVINVKDFSQLGNFPKNASVVMIFDGYSVARGKYGENTMTDKAIHIHGPQVD